MSNELTKTATTELAPMDLSAWGVEETTTKDLLIPRLMIMQGLSQNVMDGKAKMGDIVDSMTNEVLGGRDKPLEFLPFKVEKIFYVEEWKDGSWKFSAIEKVTQENVNTPNEVVRDGKKFKYTYTLNFFVLIEGKGLPYLLAFKSTSMRAGKALFTQMYVSNRALGKAPCANWMNLVVTQTKNDKGTYATIAAQPSKEASREDQLKALDWFKTLEASKFETHEEEKSFTQSEEYTRF